MRPALRVGFYSSVHSVSLEVRVQIVCDQIFMILINSAIIAATCSYTRDILIGEHMDRLNARDNMST